MADSTMDMMSNVSAWIAGTATGGLSSAVVALTRNKYANLKLLASTTLLAIKGSGYSRAMRQLSLVGRKRHLALRSGGLIPAYLPVACMFPCSSVGTIKVNLLDNDALCRASSRI